MDILYIGNFLNNINGHYDGPNVQVVKILKNLGHNVKISGTSGSQIVRFLQFIKSLFAGYLSKTNLIIIDVFSTKAFYFAVIICFMASKLGLKYLLILHGGNLPVRFEKSKFLSKLMLQNANSVVSPSGYLSKSAFDFFGTNVFIIPNKIEVGVYPPPRNHKNQIFWVRSISSIYNPEMAIEMLNYLNKYNLVFELIMIGPGDSIRINAIKELVAKLNLGHQVFIKGKMDRDQWHKIACEGKYFINTTYVDNTPSSVIEAMALGLIPISTNVGGIPFILEDSYDCILVEPNDAKSMAKAIFQIETNSFMRERFKINIRNKFNKVYNEKVIINNWEKIIGTLD
jgi:glycosyltransferase involved in cell wall biosynthesis